jgi:predicted enzyme related to lactoylglutathione lyase
MKPIANMIHVGNVNQALSWYKAAFPGSVLRDVDGFTFLEMNGFALELVLADIKVGSGKSGSVTYWEVKDLELEMLRFKSLGSLVYRGPMEIGIGVGMCQVTDPFGNLIGLRGAFYSKSDS